MTVLLLFTGGGQIGLAPLLLLEAVAALSFGVLWTLWFERGMRRLMRRIYQGDPAIVPPPPEGEYEHRLACSYMASPRMAVGGHLYLGPANWTFMPHRKNLKRHQIPVSIPVDSSLILEPVEVEIRGLARFLVRGPVYRLQIRASLGKATFVVPESSAVAARLRRYLEEAAYGGTA